MNLNDNETNEVVEEAPKLSLAKEKVLEEAKRVLDREGEKKGISIVVIGDVLCCPFFQTRNECFLQVMLMPVNLH